MMPEYEFGESVRLTRNVRNDGTYPGKEIGDLLVKRGSIGYVHNVGTYLQDQVIYSVHFMESNMLIGCRAEELIREDEEWNPGKFQFRDKVTTNRILAVSGEEIARPGDEAEILKVALQPDGEDIHEHFYHVRFPGRTLQVPESMLEFLDPADNQENETLTANPVEASS